MTANKKPIYAVHCTTSFGFGLQFVKAANQKEAKAKFKKRFKKQRILYAEKIAQPTYRQQASGI